MYKKKIPRMQIRKVSIEKMREALSAATEESYLQAIINEQQAKIDQLTTALEIERARLNGFQLELEARHYELPYIEGIVDLLTRAGKFSEPVTRLHTMLHDAVAGLVAFTNSQKPTLDPGSWIALNHKLGFVPNLQLRRTPVKLAGNSGSDK